MIRMLLIFMLFFASLAWPQTPDPRLRPDDPSAERRLPNGMKQQDEILKADHAKSLEELRQIVKLADEIRTEMEKNDRHVLSLGAVRKTEEIERLAKRIRGRMKRF
jgi:hypothetical protein